MAPVTCGIADRKKNGLVLLLGLLEGLFSPGIPVHRIVSMLEEIRAGLIDEVVGVLALLAATGCIPVFGPWRGSVPLAGR